MQDAAQALHRIDSLALEHKQVPFAALYFLRSFAKKPSASLYFFIAFPSISVLSV